MRRGRGCGKAARRLRCHAVADAWTLLTEDAREHATFASLAATLALPATPAGPQNRLRDVGRIATPHGPCFLKRFRRTQWKNRAKFALTRPFAADDAARECAMTQALRAAGIAAPRPLAIGRQGAASFYLCAELPGRPLSAALAAGVDGTLLRAAARWAGALLAKGFHLPDLSADHVFVDGDRRFGVLDLHNGALLEAAPPWATADRYDAPGKSAAYAGRNPARSTREMRLLARVWPGRPGETVLDLPCGAGRLLSLLRERFGARVLQADGSLAMLREAAARAAAPRAQADALAPPFADRSVDGVVCFRFLHHLPADAADRAIAGACAVARRFVVASFFHPCSAHGLRRLVGSWLGRPSRRYARTLGAIDRAFARHGFRRTAVAAELPFARDLWVAAFERAPSTLG